LPPRSSSDHHSATGKIIAYIAWYDALQALSTANTGVFLYIEPLIAMMVAFFVLGEPITVASLFGSSVILFGCGW